MPKKSSSKNGTDQSSQTVKQMVLIQRDHLEWLHTTAKRTDHNMSDITRVLFDQAMNDPEFEVKLRRITLEARLNKLAAEHEAKLQEKKRIELELQNLSAKA